MDISQTASDISWDSRFKVWACCTCVVKEGLCIPLQENNDFTTSSLIVTKIIYNGPIEES
jgi:hypothetical protein